MSRLFLSLFLFYPFISIAQIPAIDSSRLIHPREFSQLIPPQDPSNLISNKFFTLEQGALIQLILLNEVSSKSIKEGDTLYLSVDSNVIVNDKIVVKVGTSVIGIIEKAVKAKGGGKPGELGFTFRYLKAVDGTKITLRSLDLNKEGRKKVGETIVKTIFFPPAIFGKGSNVKMDKGTIIKAYTDKDYIIQIAE